MCLLCACDASKMAAGCRLLRSHSLCAPFPFAHLFRYPFLWSVATICNLSFSRLRKVSRCPSRFGLLCVSCLEPNLDRVLFPFPVLDSCASLLSFASVSSLLASGFPHLSSLVLLPHPFPCVSCLASFSSIFSFIDCVCTVPLMC